MMPAVLGLEHFLDLGVIQLLENRPQPVGHAHQDVARVPVAKEKPGIAQTRHDFVGDIERHVAAVEAEEVVGLYFARRRSRRRSACSRERRRESRSAASWHAPSSCTMYVDPPLARLVSSGAGHERKSAQVMAERLAGQ